MKKFIAFTLMLVLILACLAPAIAATAELPPCPTEELHKLVT